MNHRIHFNYLFLLVAISYLFYISDKQHREDYIKMSKEKDEINEFRVKEQMQHQANMVFYTDKFNNLLEILIKQREEQKKK